MIIQIPCDMLALYILQNGSSPSSITEKELIRLTEDYLHPILKYRPNAVYLNVCYRRAAVPSEVFSTFASDILPDGNGDPIKNASGLSVKKRISYPNNIYWVSPYHEALLTVYGTLLNRGIDLCAMAMKIIKESGTKLYLSVRPSDNHGWFGMGTDFLVKNSLPEDGRPDFSKACIRNYFQNFITELLRNYDPDGIEIDWLRKMPVLPNDMLNNTSVISDYMRSLRKTVSAFGDKKLSVRVFPTVQKNLKNAMDVCGWIADGLVDSITLENFYIPTNFEIPIDEWRYEIAERNVLKHPYKIHCGSDWAVTCGLPFSHYMTPALVRGFATSNIEQGADDIYLFNMADCNPETTVEINQATGKLESCVESRFEAAANPDEGVRRYVYVSGCDTRYPITIAAGESKTFTIYTGRSGAEYRLYLCAADRSDLNIHLNSHPMSALYDEPHIPGFETPENTDALSVRYYRGQFDRFVRYARAQKQEDIQHGFNTFTIFNTGSKDTAISWIEVEIR